MKSTKPKIIKPKKCPECKEYFTPYISTLQKLCGPKCAADKARRDTKKERKQKDKKEIDVLREKHKDAKFYKKILTSVFNTFIKLRDRENGCISCGTKKPDIQYAAGHYWTVGSAPALRYNEDNCHLQCNMNCNKNRSGNITEYRPNLIKKIGIERYEYLESQKGVAKHYTVDELKEMIVIYRAKIKELTNETQAQTDQGI